MQLNREFWHSHGREKDRFDFAVATAVPGGMAGGLFWSPLSMPRAALERSRAGNVSAVFSTSTTARPREVGSDQHQGGRDRVSAHDAHGGCVAHRAVGHDRHTSHPRGLQLWLLSASGVFTKDIAQGLWVEHL